MQRLWTSNVSISNGIMGTFTAKNDFPIGYYVTIADADIGGLKSLHTLFDKYLDHMLLKFEQNRSKLYKILSFMTKTVNHFD